VDLFAELVEVENDLALELGVPYKVGNPVGVCSILDDDPHASSSLARHVPRGEL
jgi:hypothetical protein